MLFRVSCPVWNVGKSPRVQTFSKTADSTVLGYRLSHLVRYEILTQVSIQRFIWTVKHIKCIMSSKTFWPKLTFKFQHGLKYVNKKRGKSQTRSNIRFGFWWHASDNPNIIVKCGPGLHSTAGQLHQGGGRHLSVITSNIFKVSQAYKNGV